MLMFFYLYPNDVLPSPVGFANSLEEFHAINNAKSYPYNYKDENLKSMVLRPDVFAGARIEGMSNFVDYPKIATSVVKPIEA